MRPATSNTIDRTFLYTSNIAVNQGQPQPLHFMLGEPLRLTDANGHELTARVVDIVGRAASSEVIMLRCAEIESRANRLEPDAGTPS